MEIVIVLNHYSKFTKRDFLLFSNNLGKRLNQCVSIGVGKPYTGLIQMHRSKEEACDALEWNINHAPVIDSCDVDDVKRKSKTSILGIRKEIMEQFQNGELWKLNEVLTLLAEQVRSSTVIQPDAPYPTSIRRTMIELLVEMLHIASDEGVDVDSVIGYVDPYRKIFELQGTPAIIQWVTEIARDLTEAMQLRKKRIEQTRLAQVKTYIQEHLSDMELSLTTASKFVSMSPSYFSAFFIREAGVGFKEYVTLERIKLAQKLLRESKDSINVISERCGFLSPSYFISVFKNQTGMTPGAYRKLKN